VARVVTSASACSLQVESVDGVPGTAEPKIAEADEQGSEAPPKVG
jgi:hypothetical protein